mgnify:CR=1 FL=1
MLFGLRTFPRRSHSDVSLALGKQAQHQAPTLPPPPRGPCCRPCPNWRGAQELDTEEKTSCGDVFPLGTRSAADSTKAELCLPGYQHSRLCLPPLLTGGGGGRRPQQRPFRTRLLFLFDSECWSWRRRMRQQLALKTMLGKTCCLRHPLRRAPCAEAQLALPVMVPPARVSQANAISTLLTLNG